ncbi:MAG: hydrolase Nlp/P60 [Bacteroidetes bacterium]|nr:MAG: hydrolase Nlp/P60 [Bacteroidota bacterium]
MAFGICNVSIMPLRADADDRSEMVSQVLFGETLDVLEMRSNWAFVRVLTDRYEGWVDPKQFVIIDDAELNKVSTAKLYYTTDLVQILTHVKSKQMIPLVMGSHLPGLYARKLELGGEQYIFDGSSIPSIIKPTRKRILENAMMYINAPYLWGGKSPFGIDCSGFSQTVYKVSGIMLNRDASQQALQGETVNFITDALAGDLAFFDNEDGNIIHVGILLGDNKIIHASGKVRIDAIDHQGIFNVDTRKYSHKLRIIKSYI